MSELKGWKYDTTFLIIFEESYDYLVGVYFRDKDLYYNLSRIELKIKYKFCVIEK